MKRLALLLMLILTPLALSAQGFRTLYGKAVDTRTGDPVAFASVRIQDSGLSNVTNADGYFSLKIPEDTGDSASPGKNLKC